MRTPKTVYPDQRIIYHPEVTVCPHCAGALHLVNYYAWDKTVQTLDGVFSVASRPACCANPDCPGAARRIRAAAAQQIALPGSSYGYDVLAQIGWQRQQQHATFAEIHATLAPSVQISLAQGRQLYQQVYLPLLACHERQQADRLTAAVTQHGGLIIALDGLAPEGGEAQLWCIRELLIGLTLRCGWLGQQDQATVEAFLQPLAQVDWPILPIVSDKQRGLVPAVAALFPTSAHQFCQAHYLRNLAEPLAAADTTFTVTLRKAVRAAVGELIRTEGRGNGPAPGVLTLTGIVPDEPVGTATAPALAADPAASAADHVVSQVLRRTRYLLTMKGRPPLRLAGSETYQRLQEVLSLSAELLAHRADARLAQFQCGLAAALAEVAPAVPDLDQGTTWRHEIAALLEPGPGEVSSSTVAGRVRGYLDPLLGEPGVSPQLEAFRRHVVGVSERYWDGRFHCYARMEVPRTNNGLESAFREVQRRLLRTTGQRGATRRAVQRRGAWELLARQTPMREQVAALRPVPPAALKVEQQRMQQHQERFRLHTRSLRQANLQFDRLRQQWHALPPTLTE